MNPSKFYIISDSQQPIGNLASSFWGEIEGDKVSSIEDLYVHFSKAFLVPYPITNLDAFEEVINDLQWLDESNIYLYVKRTKLFLINEINENITTLLSILQDGINNWNDFKDDNLFIPKTFIVLFDESERIKSILSDNDFFFEEFISE